MDYFLGNWYNLNSTAIARNWTVDRAGTSRAQLAMSSSMTSLAWAINHLCCRQPRVVFCQAQPYGYTSTAIPWGTLQTAGAAPLYSWQYPDIVQNATERAARILACPTLATTSQCYVGWDSQTSAKINARHHDIDYKPSDMYLVELTKSGRTPSGATASDQVNTYNGFTIADIVVQDNAIATVDSTKHVYVSAAPARPGQPIMAGTGIDGLEGMRAAFHEIRTTNLPIDIQWAALAGAAGYQTPAASNEHGIVVTSTAYVNVIDQTATTLRDADTPGVPLWGQYCGVGSQVPTSGQSAKLKCGVYAMSSGGGTVKFIGPNHVSDNYQEIAVTSTATPLWLYAPSVVNINTTIADTDTTAARNKIDIQAKAVTGTVSIFGLVGWREY